jgi:PIN domain nuclease of toxin-antitoxin system
LARGAASAVTAWKIAVLVDTGRINLDCRFGEKHGAQRQFAAAS